MCLTASCVKAIRRRKQSIQHLCGAFQAANKWLINHWSKPNGHTQGVSAQHRMEGGRKATLVRLQHFHTYKEGGNCSILNIIKLQFYGGVQAWELHRRHIWYGGMYQSVKLGCLGHEQLSSRALWKEVKLGFLRNPLRKWDCKRNNYHYHRNDSHTAGGWGTPWANVFGGLWCLGREQRWELWDCLGFLWISSLVVLGMDSAAPVASKCPQPGHSEVTQKKSPGGN